MNYEKKGISKYIIILFFVPIFFHVLFEILSEDFSLFFVIGVPSLSVLVIVLSMIVIKKICIDMDNSFVDFEFVIIFNILLWILFVFRYALSVLVSGSKPFCGQEVPVYASSVALILFIPLVKNYNLNKKTVIFSMITSLVNIYIIVPLIIFVVQKMVNNDYVILGAVCDRCYSYNSMIVKSMIFFEDFMDIELSGVLLYLVYAMYSIYIYIIMYIPILIIDIYYIDKRTYLGNGRCAKVKKYIIYASIATIAMMVLVYKGSRFSSNMASSFLHY